MNTENNAQPESDGIAEAAITVTAAKGKAGRPNSRKEFLRKKRLRKISNASRRLNRRKARGLR